jgi:hypothetical protein
MRPIKAETAQNVELMMSKMVALSDGNVVVLPDGDFPAPSADVMALQAINPRRAALHYAIEAAVKDADGVELKLSPFAARDWLAQGAPILSGPEITEETANVGSYLRARVIFDAPHLFAPERSGQGKCDCCGNVGPGWIQLAPDAMLTPSEVGFVGDCCSH